MLLKKIKEDKTALNDNYGVLKDINSQGQRDGEVNISNKIMEASQRLDK